MGRTRFRIDDDLGVVITASEGDLTSADVLEALRDRSAPAIDPSSTSCGTCALCASS